VWPGSLVAFFTFIFGLPVLGHFYNDLVMQTGVAFPLVIVALLIVAVLSATAHDAVNPTEGLEE
jgi:hypothetical protein